MRRMRIGVLAVIGHVFVVTNVLADGNMAATNGSLKAVAGVHIDGELPQRTVAGEAIVIMLTLTNDSSDEVKYVLTYPEREFSVAIKDFSGVAVPMTRYGQEIMRATSGGAKYLTKTLSPGESVPSCLNIARLFDLTMAGRYVVAVARTIDEGVPGKERQVSVEIALVVREPRR